VGSRNTKNPIKKPRGGELTQDQKDFNRNVSQKRVYVEHLIRVIKIGSSGFLVIRQANKK